MLLEFFPLPPSISSLPPLFLTLHVGKYDILYWYFSCSIDILYYCSPMSENHQFVPPPYLPFLLISFLLKLLFPFLKVSFPLSLLVVLKISFLPSWLGLSFSLSSSCPSVKHLLLSHPWPCCVFMPLPWHFVLCPPSYLATQRLAAFQATAPLPCPQAAVVRQGNNL